MSRALKRLREYFFSTHDFEAFRASHDVRLFDSPDSAASRVEVYDRDGARTNDTYAHNEDRTRRRKLPFMIEHFDRDADGVEFVERWDVSTSSEQPLYMARYLDATGCELRVSHGHAWFLTEKVRAALRVGFRRPMFPKARGTLGFSPRTIHDRVENLVLMELAPRVTLVFATQP